MVAFLNYLHLHMQVKYEVSISSCNPMGFGLSIVYVPFCYQLHCFKINNKIISDDENIYFGKTWVA